MPVTPFTEELDLAKAVLLEATVAEHGRTVRDIKTKVQALPALQKLVRNGLPGSSSDYRRIMGDEAFYRPLLKTRFLLPSADPVVLSHLAALHGPCRFPRLGTAEDIRRAIASGHELNAVMVETHLLAVAWAPKFSTKEKIVLGGIEFVKLAMAVYSIVSSTGTAIGSIQEAYHSAASGAQMLIDAVGQLDLSGLSSAGDAFSSAASSAKAAGSAVGEVVSGAMGVYEQRTGFAVLRDPTDQTALTTRGGVQFSGGTLATGRHREAMGTDLSVLNYGDLKAALLDEEVVKSMSFVAIQQITPVRSNCVGTVQIERGARGAIEDVPVALCYSAALELAAESVIRVGPVLRDSAAAMASRLKADDMEALVYPWDNRGIDGRTLPFVEYARRRTASAFADLSANAAPLANLQSLDWDGMGWADSGESLAMRAPYELSAGAQAAMQQAQSQVLQLFARVHSRREAGAAMANAGAQAALARARARIDQRRDADAARRAADQRAAEAEAERLRLERRGRAMQRHMMSASEFATATERGLLARRDPLLKSVDTLLGQYALLADDAFVRRTEALVAIQQLLDTYLSLKPATTKRSVIDRLLTGLRQEQTALKQQLLAVPVP